VGRRCCAGRWFARGRLPLASGVAIVLASSPSPGRPGPEPDRAFLSRLGEGARRLETLMNRATFMVTGAVETVAGDGTVTERKEGVFRVDPRRTPAHVDWVWYREDGKDRTPEARGRSRDDERKRAGSPPDPGQAIHLPFLRVEQPKYRFRIGERDPRARTRVRVYFEARRSAKNLGNGSAWVDGDTGEILSIGVSPSKTPPLVDYIDVTVVFGAQTPFGRAVSRATLETRGGFLFFRKHLRGWMTVSKYRFP